jgi:hypothetical protein
MKAHRIVPVVIALLLAASAALAEKRPAFAEGIGLVGEVEIAPAPEPEYLPIVVRCPECTADAQPVVGFLYFAGDQATTDAVFSVRATDWQAGRFEIGSGGPVIQGNPTRDGWTAWVPLEGRGLPDRVLGGMAGWVAQRAAYWPARERGIVPTFDLAPLAQVLDENPTWDPSLTDECDLLVPKEADVPLTFRVAGEPVAWLYPGATGADGSWTFQFVKPGSCLLERVSVEVRPFDEGADWGFRVPLELIVREHAERRPELAVSDSDVTKLRDDVRTVGSSVDAGPLGTVDFADCPRQPR